MKEPERNIELAKYWINKLTDNWKDELSHSDDYKKYYLPLKSFLIHQLGKYTEPKVIDRIALEFEVPKIYYNVDYQKIVKENFKGLFKIIESIMGSYDYDGIYLSSYKERCLYSEEMLKYVQSEAEEYKIINEIPSPMIFAKDYIDQSRYKSSNWLKDMEQFLIAITPTPIPTYIENLLEQIDKDNLNDVIPKEKQIKLKDTSEGMRNKYGYFYQDWKNLTKQQQVEILADMARKDTVITQNQWWNNFKAEFPEGYSTELGRYRDKFKIKNRHQQFKINGLIFYKGKE